MSGDEKIIMGGIVKHSKGIGFKVTFTSPETANKYKDMFRWILVNDNHPLIYLKGYYDKKRYLEDG